MLLKANRVFLCALYIITKQKQGGTYSILYITTETALQTTFKTRISHFNLREDVRAAYWSYLSRKTEYSCMKETNWREKMLQIQPLHKGLINKCMLTNTYAHLTRYLKKPCCITGWKTAKKFPSLNYCVFGIQVHHPVSGSSASTTGQGVLPVGHYQSALPPQSPLYLQLIGQSMQHAHYVSCSSIFKHWNLSFNCKVVTLLPGLVPARATLWCICAPE